MNEHAPVLIEEIVEILRFFSFTDCIVDATLGHGGYSQKILESFCHANVIGLDQDQDAIEVANERLSIYRNRFMSIHINFKKIRDISSVLNYKSISAVIFDLGVSTLQITKSSRGFSFQNEGPLDMRMDQKGNNITAYDIINTWDRDKLTNLFYKYGEDRFSRKIALEIERYRNKNGIIYTTTELVNIIRNVVPKSLQRKIKIHPARKIFQALRVYINDELNVLEDGLEGALEICNKNAAIVVVSYQSMEDKIVKLKFNDFENRNLGYVLSKKIITPSSEELSNNYKSRSAKMRIFIKTEEANAKRERLKWKSYLDQKKNLSILA